MEKRIKILNIAGLVLGLIAVIVGIYLAAYSDGMFARRQAIQFGGDFYTEIYDVVEQTRFSVMGVGHAVSQLVNAIGYAIILAGLLDIIVFAKKLVPEMGKKAAAAPVAAPAAPAAPAAVEQAETQNEEAAE